MSCSAGFYRVRSCWMKSKVKLEMGRARARLAGTGR